MFIVLPSGQAALVRRALARLAGLPRRAKVYKDGAENPALTAELAIDVPDCVDIGDDDGTLACIELPPQLEQYLGRTVTIAGKSITLPTLADLVADESALPAAIKALRQAKREG